MVECAAATAIAGQDYTATLGTLSFAAGEAVKTFSVALNNDAVGEAAESLLVSISNVQVNSGAATIATATGTVTIADDDLTVLELADAVGYGAARHLELLGQIGHVHARVLAQQADQCVVQLIHLFISTLYSVILIDK